MYNVTSIKYTAVTKDEKGNIISNIEIEKKFDELPVWKELTEQHLNFLRSLGYVFDYGVFDIVPVKEEDQVTEDEPATA